MDTQCCFIISATTELAQRSQRRHRIPGGSLQLGADGSIGTPTVFDAEQGYTKRKAKALRLKSIKRLPDGVLWMLYLVRK
jgi:hypothetical protein